LTAKKYHPSDIFVGSIRQEEYITNPNISVVLPGFKTSPYSTPLF
jgi:hypothetical protein